MSDGTLEPAGDRHALRFERTVTRSVGRVWRAVTARADLEQWFPAAVDWTPAVGEEIEAPSMTGLVTEVAEPHRLAWTFNGDDYSFDLTPDGEGTHLVFVHVFDQRGIAAQTAAGWESYLGRLRPLLDGEPLSESDAHAAWGADHERYAAAFGVDPGPGRQFWKRLQSGEERG